METDESYQYEFYRSLQQFTGTRCYYLHTFNRRFLSLTEGAYFVRNEAKASWLFNTIIRLQNHSLIGKQSHQIWQLKRESRKHWILGCLDKNRNVLYGNRIGYVDFPLDEFELWVIDGVALLPSEY